MKVVSHQAIQIQFKIAVILDSDKLNPVKSLTGLKFINLSVSVKIVNLHPPVDIVAQSLMEEDG